MTFPFDPPDYHDQQEQLYEIIGFHDYDRDSLVNPNFNEEVHNMFFNVMYNDELTLDERVDLENLMAEILVSEYGLLFDDLWSWDDFRSWYDTA